MTVPSRTVIPRVNGGGMFICHDKITSPMSIVVNLHARTRMRVMQKLSINSAVLASNALRLHGKVPIRLRTVGWRLGGCFCRCFQA